MKDSFIVNKNFEKSKDLGGNMEISLTEALTYFYTKPEFKFYAHLINSLEIEKSPGVGTFGVGIHAAGRYKLIYDEKFLNKMPVQELMFTIEHEVNHIILGHIPRYLSLISSLDEKNKSKYKEIANIAADFCCNELILKNPSLTEEKRKYFYGCEETEDRFFLLPDTYKLPSGKTYEVYFDLLLKQEQLAQGAGEQHMQKHAAWDIPGKDGVTNTEALQGLAYKLKQEGKAILKKANDACKKAGTVPNHLSEILKKLLQEQTIPWYVLLRNMVSTVRRTKVKRGMSRPNRRLYGVPQVLPFPGKKKDRAFNIFYALDTSGSMSKRDMALGLRELINITKGEHDVTVSVVYADAEVQKIYKVKEERDVDFSVCGRGGTNFNPVFKKVKEFFGTKDQPDVLIYCTDGYASPVSEEYRVSIPVIWLITPSGRAPDYGYGHVIRCK